MWTGEHGGGIDGVVTGEPTTVVAAGREQLWRRVDALVDRAPSLHDLAVHRLAVLAAHRWRERGRRVPIELGFAELDAVSRISMASSVLRQVVERLDQEVILLKGLGVAQRYPEPYLRPFADLDLLVPDPARAQRRLLEAGFVPGSSRDADDYLGFHHEPPLVLPGWESMPIEIHGRANGVTWGYRPSFDDLYAGSLLGPEPGVRYPDRISHAVLLASHAWESAPLGRVGDLLDIALMVDAGEVSSAHALAAGWGVARLWRQSMSAIAHLFGDGPRPSALEVWARGLDPPRELTLAETHLRRWLGPFWALSPTTAARHAGRAIREDAAPIAGESWAEKLARVGEGLRHPSRTISQHDEVLGERSRRLRPLRRVADGGRTRPGRGDGEWPPSAPSDGRRRPG